MARKYLIVFLFVRILLFAAGCVRAADIHEESNLSFSVTAGRQTMFLQTNTSKNATVLEDDILNGFDEEKHETESIAIASAEDKVKSSRVSLDGYIKLGLTYNFAHNEPVEGETDWRGLSRLRPELALNITTKITHDWRGYLGVRGFYDLVYTFRDRDEFTKEVIDEYEKEAEFTEVYVQGRLSRSLDVKIGRQIVVWGRSDYIRITDILNPLDNREPGLTDIEDLRLPLAMTRLDYFSNAWNLTTLAIHETCYNKNPTYGHDFYPYQERQPPEEKQSSNFSSTQWAVALNGTFNQKDVSLYWADLFNPEAHIEYNGSSSTPVRWHERVQLLGWALNIAKSNWLLKSEGSFLNGIKFANTGGEEFMRSNVLIGLEYNGFTNTRISADISRRKLHNFEKILESKPDYEQELEWRSAFSWSKDFLNQNLNVMFLALLFGETGQDGAIYRLSCQYDLNDAWEIKLGVALYESGDLYILRDIGDNDRIFAELKYLF